MVEFLEFFWEAIRDVFFTPEPKILLDKDIPTTGDLPVGRGA